MSKLVLAALIGVIVTTLAGIVVSIACDVSFKAFIPLYMPWCVLLLIKLTNRRK
ncbi:MAG: hypothetical protein ACJ77K_16660 [Bacteroidia bacterium]